LSLGTVVELCRGDGATLREPLIFPHGTGALLVLPDALECPSCHRMCRLAVNRGGETLCLGCDKGEPALQTSAPK
jgi:hypothetical protein